MNQVSTFGRTVLAATAGQPRYAFRVVFEVARIRRAYPAAHVDVIPVG